MNDTDAFLRKIRENPDDDAPRLVFADYLDELAEKPKNKQAKQQTRWAKLIRGQIGMRYQTEAEASFWRNLVDADPAYGCKIASEVMPKSMRGKSWLSLNRGFYDQVSLDLRKFREVSDDLMNSDAPIRKLTLKSAGSNWADVAEVPAFQLIRELEFTVGSHTSDIRNFFTRSLKHLTGLVLPSSGKVTSVGLPLLAKLKDGPVLKRFQGLYIDQDNKWTELLNSTALSQLEEFHQGGLYDPVVYHKLSQAPMSKTLSKIYITDYHETNTYDQLEWGQFEKLRDLTLYCRYYGKWISLFLKKQNLQGLHRTILKGGGLPPDILDHFIDTDVSIELNLEEYPVKKLSTLLSSAGMERVTALVIRRDFPDEGYQLLEENPHACNIGKLEIAGRGYEPIQELEFDKLISCSKFQKLIYLRVGFHVTLDLIKRIVDSSLAESLLGTYLSIGYRQEDIDKVVKILETRQNLIFGGSYYDYHDSRSITNWLR